MGDDEDPQGDSPIQQRSRNDVKKLKTITPENLLKCFYKEEEDQLGSNQQLTKDQFNTLMNVQDRLIRSFIPLHGNEPQQGH